MLNQVTLIGRLTHEPHVKTTEDGKKVSDIQIAVQRFQKIWMGFMKQILFHVVYGKVQLRLSKTTVKKAQWLQSAVGCKQKEK